MHIALPFIPLLAILAVVCIAACGPSLDPQRRRQRSSLIVGLLIVAIGTVLLLDRLGIMDAQDVFRYWPVILIVLALNGIIHADRPGKVVFNGMVGLAGVLLLLTELRILHVTFEEIWPVFIIAAGLLTMWGALFPRARVVHIGPMQQAAPSSSPHLNVVSIFADGRWTVTAQDFENGYIRAVFGGFKVDMTQANMTGSRAYVTLDVVFAGGEIRIPDSWNVLIEAQPVFGSCEDKTRRQQQPATAKTLVLRGKVVFGGIEVRN